LATNILGERLTPSLAVMLANVGGEGKEEKKGRGRERGDRPPPLQIHGEPPLLL